MSLITTYPLAESLSLSDGSFVAVLCEPIQLDSAGMSLRKRGVEVRDCTVIYLQSLNLFSLIGHTELTSDTFLGRYLKGGLGAIEVEASRTPADYDPSELRFSKIPSRKRGVFINFGTGEMQDVGRHNSAGRFPTNILFSKSSSTLLDKITGDLGSGYRPNRSQSEGGNKRHLFQNESFKMGEKTYEDSGGASRFFRDVENLEALVKYLTDLFTGPVKVDV